MKAKTHILPFFATLTLICLTTAQHHSFSSNAGPRDSQTIHIKQSQRHLLHYREELDIEDEYLMLPACLKFDNPRLRSAYIALQAWKLAIISDPLNLTSNWVGSDVCSYTGVFCATSLDNSSIQTVAGIDLNHGDMAGHLVEELGLLTDIALFHVNSNRFCGKVPRSFKKLKLLYELDLSNNRFAGRFPYVVLDLPKLKYLDLRFNEFEGDLPKELFDKDLDAIFMNHNRFALELPDNFGNSPVSVIVLANNKFHGCFPTSLVNMSKTLNEVILMNNGLRSCLPREIGLLKKVTVFDASNNKLFGSLPDNIGEMESLELLNVAHNMLSGNIPGSVCLLPHLKNFSYAYNFFTGEPPACLDLENFDDGRNCLRNRPKQRSTLQCKVFLSRPVKCEAFKCHKFDPSPPPPPVTSPPYQSPPPPPPPPPCHEQPPPPPSPPPCHEQPPPPSPPVQYLLPPPPPVYNSPPPPAPVYNGPLPPISGIPYASPPPPPLY
ncbi:PREDICTED: leucine-rich repeat extensin-like protein 3 isoform X1 [Populus euphratica]|uniref:Cell wall hydroxyproline-rich glycoprotein n=1 Tax=Populus euphratica TaxID=75702 RepID=A0AAJ6TYW9_POPEU|nr:PREDICTED: leucine-rich repeat extensin-like protein 3 isoform X1 [Populus euphratica]